MKFRWGRVMRSSAAKEAVVGRNGDGHIAGFRVNVKDRPDSDLDGKEEIFFDSRRWLDSDCEDDFYSVNGDFAPSRGSTPNREFSNPGTPRLNKGSPFHTFPDTKSESSPKKKLDLLLQEAQSNEADNEQTVNNTKEESNKKTEFQKDNMNQPPNTILVPTPQLTGEKAVSSTEQTPNGTVKNEEIKSRKGMHCCLPSLGRSFSFRKKKQRPSSP